jgi:hypothetical protein
MAWGTTESVGGGFTSTATRIPFGGSGTALTESADFTWNDTTKTLTLAGAGADQIINASTGNASFKMQKNGTDWLTIAQGTFGTNFTFLASGSLTGFIAAGASSVISFTVGGYEGLGIRGNGDVVIGNGDSAQTVLATNVTGGFLRLPECAGAPTGAAVDGAIVVDSTNDRLYVRVDGAWLSAALA